MKMANLYSYFTGKRDIKHSKFDMSFQNLFTSNFGELKPCACYEVLGGDEWKVAQNTITKVAPMPAPAFTRIKQNFYSFFCPNQIIWKHWNDFITNGTAYLDTYGNNQTNQQITNQWLQPSIMVNDLQLHSKLANGWALPCFRLSSDDILLLITKLSPVWKADNLSPSSSEKDHFDKGFISLYFPDSFSFPIILDDFISSSLFSLLIAHSDTVLPDFFSRIPYLHPRFLLQGRSAFTYEGAAWRSYNFKLTDFTFCCDFHTAVEFYHWLHDDVFNSSSNQDITDTTLHSDSSITTTEHDTVASWQTGLGSSDSVVRWCYAMRYFCNPYVDNCRLDEGPFILKKRTFRTIDSIGQTLNTFSAEKNIVNLQEHKYSQQFDYYYNATKYVVTCDITYQRAGFYGRLYGSGYFIDENGERREVIHIVNGIVEYVLPGIYGGIRPLFMKPVESIEDLDWIFGFDMDFSSLHCGADLIRKDPSIFTNISSSVILNEFAYDYITGDGVLNSGMPFMNDFTPFIKRYRSNTQVYYGTYFAPSDVAFHYYPMLDPDNPDMSLDNKLLYKIPDHDIYGSDSFSVGYDSFGFMVYNSMQVCKLLDSFNIPLEGPTSSSWEKYAGELINCLPFFAYSKVINDYFRNKTTTSAELDFRETNSVALMDSSRRSYLNHLKNMNYPLSRQVLDLIERFPNEGVGTSWVIPFCTAPKNGLSGFSVEFQSTDFFVQYAKNEFHYFNISDYIDLFSIVSGFQLTDQVVEKMLDFVYKNNDFSPNNYIVLRGMLVENIYLPNYYNGFMRMKFQNFSKDYFSSAMLDPMHGANEVQIGDTISDLRTEIVEQNFWESFAMARSLKHAFQSMMGITPTHIEQDKPLLLGMDHIPVNIGEVIQTSQTDITPQGKRTGLGAAHGKAGLCKHYFNENGYLIVLNSFTVEQQYSQGLEHQWTPFESFLDYPWIQMAHIGNESIPLRELKWNPSADYRRKGVINHVLIPSYNTEGSKVLMDGRHSPLFVRLADRTQVYAQANVVDKDGVDDSSKGFDEIFGYVPRNSNYKFKLDQVHGAFRNQMEYWQTFRKFYKNPILTHEFVNWEFVADDGDLNRLFAVEDDNVADKFYCDCYINALVSRPLPVVNVPSTK